MTVSIDFPPDLETRLREQAALAGQDVGSFVRQVVAERLADRMERTPRSHEEFVQRLNAWIALHPVLDHAIDDSREAIYADD